jgi:methylated-DNA-protein-cysteine methyltransferase related protein
MAVMDHASIHALVRTIPAGRVTTYGSVARRAGIRSARVVGYALATLPDAAGVPWHRVINSRGSISLSGESAVRQRTLLEAEGVCFDARGRVDLHRFGWHDDDPFL